MSEFRSTMQKKLSRHRILNQDVAAVFNSYPRTVRSKMRSLRALIIDTATTIEGVGELEEALKWGEPSYVTSQSKSGSTVRIDWKRKDPTNIAIYFKCTADLVPLFRKRFKSAFCFEGNRAIVLSLDAELPINELKLCVGLALTYHRNKKLPSKSRWLEISKLLGCK